MAAPFLPVFALLFIASRITPALGAVPRFGAIDHAAIFPVDAAMPAAGIAPRTYAEGIPAVPAQLFSANPRHLLSGHAFNARQAQCDPGSHSCVETGVTGASYCCPNDRYCYLDENWDTKCCALGIKCPGSVCNATQLYCNQTSTITAPLASTPATSQEEGSVVTLTSTLSYSTYAACCNRPCGSASFSCEQLYGGLCCSYGNKCATGGSCIADPAPSTTAPGGCAVPCAQADGGGCCSSGSICSMSSISPATSTAVCVSNSTITDVSSSKGLSTGAKAGIGVGVAVGAALIIAAATWVCIRKRQRRRTGTTGTNASAHEMRQNGGSDGRHKEAGDQADSLLAGPMTPWTYRSTFTEASAGGRYFGPDAIPGPFTTDPDDDRHPALDSRLATTPPTQVIPGDGAEFPFSPNAITKPVEIGGIESQKEKDNDEEMGDGKLAHAEDEDGPFELMGSPGSPSPLSPDDKGPSSPFPGEAGKGAK
ncbi:hypothetical protein F5Y10DRAFT_211641 [Nemania abortiva]|nr:hypothetical protein F5Y10DRAFT_211641 [Nemania abortiva]